MGLFSAGHTFAWPVVWGRGLVAVAVSLPGGGGGGQGCPGLRVAKSGFSRFGVGVKPGLWFGAQIRGVVPVPGTSRPHQHNFLGNRRTQTTAAPFA